MAFTRQRVWEIVEIERHKDKLGRSFGIFIVCLILLNVSAVVLESVDQIHLRFAKEFWLFEVFSVAVFTLEYVARLWACVESPQYHKPIIGRIKYAFRLMSVFDLLTILPLYLPMLFGMDLRFLRAVRMLRIFRLVKVGRYYTSLNLIVRVFRSRREELIMTSCVMLVLLLISSCLMYYCEREAQPDKFPHIPAAMWWSVATLTTVGYGDIFPITGVGKFLASIIAVLGVGMFALPAGIVGSGFVEEIQRHKHKRDPNCPHCGKRIE